MHRSTIRYCLLAGLLVGAALLIPTSAAGPPPAAVAIGGALAVLGFGAVLFWIAWSAGEWPPAFLALGCFSMAAAAVTHLVTSPIVPLLNGSGASQVMPAVGMIAGGFWFGLGAFPRRLASIRGRYGPRAVLVLGLASTTVGMVLATTTVGAPPEAALRIAGAFACVGYVHAGTQTLRAYRFLRLPSQVAITVGCFLFVPVTLFVAAGGFPILPAWLQQSLILAVASLPVAGFVIEQRSRPGLRTMILALSVPRAVGAMRRGYPARLTTLLVQVDEHDPALRGHIDRVADLAVRTAHAMGVEGDGLREVMLAGQLHDIGKLFIPRDILDTPRRLSPAEVARVQEHAALGEQLVRRIPELAAAAAAVGQHHERWDGTGYPHGLSGEAIRLSARIIAAADVFDALVSERPYKSAWSAVEALAELSRGAGTHFDPRVVRTLETIVENREATRRAA